MNNGTGEHRGRPLVMRAETSRMDRQAPRASVSLVLGLYDIRPSAMVLVGFLVTIKYPFFTWSWGCVDHVPAAPVSRR